MTDATPTLRARAKLFLGRWLFAWLFLGKILVFAAIYWSIFFFRQDAFNFAVGYNVTPLSSFQQEFFSPEDEANYFLDGAQDLTSAFRIKAAEVDAARRAMLRAEAEERAEEERYQAAIDTFQDRTEERIEAYRQENIVPLEQREAEIQEFRDGLPSGSDEAIALSDERLAISEEILRHLTYIVENRIVFSSDQDQTEFYAARDLRDQARAETQLAAENYRTLRVELLDHFWETRNQMLSRVGFLDFVYFSACISTTTTFGDITANSPAVRVLVVFQIIFGIIILAGFLDSVRRSNS